MSRCKKELRLSKDCVRRVILERWRRRWVKMLLCTHLHHCHHGGHNLFHRLTIRSWKTSHQKYWMPQIENWYYSGGGWPSPSVEGGLLVLFFSSYYFHFPDNDFLMVFTFEIIIVECFHFPDDNYLMFSLGRGERDWASGGRVSKSRPDYQGW